MCLEIDMFHSIVSIFKLNHQLQNTPYMTTRMGLDMFKQNSEYVKLLNSN